MKRSIFSFTFILMCLTGSFSQESDSAPAWRADEISKRADSLISLMTLAEKIGQMNQYNGFWDVTGPAPASGDAAKKYEHVRNGRVGSMLNVQGSEEVRKVQRIAVEESRLGIPLIIGFDVIHGYKTISPIPLAEAASWDMEAIRKSAGVAASEAAASGINWTFAPMVDISRDPRWGRIMEGAGEDPFLGSKIAFARVKGFQGDDLAATNTIAACSKHFAAYGFSEAGKDYNTVDIGTSTLYNIVFPPFLATIEAGVKTFMNSFNELDGIPATANRYLQRDVLKGDWGFEGFVVSDWGSINELIPHGYAVDGKQAAMLAVNAGSDMDMESYHYVNHLEALVEEGTVKESLIDDAVKRILRVKYELGLMDDPYKYCDPEREKRVLGSPDLQDLVLDMARKSIVLLKNENKLLPLSKSGLDIALIGALAADKDSPLGSWRLAAENNSAVSVLEGLQNYKGNSVAYTKGPDLVVGETTFIMETQINSTDRSGFDEAVQAAKDKDVVIMVLGEHGFQTGEGRSRTSLDLPGLQQDLLEAVYAVNSNIVLVLMNGRPLTINWAEEHVPAILETWHLGTQSGNAIAEVLFGDYNPSGKLPMTFPRSVGQIPVYYNYKNTGRPDLPAPGLVFWTHYMDESNDPLYEFGYGLSYTNFTYSGLSLSDTTMEGAGSLSLTFTLTNTGEYEGTEVAQLYIRDLKGSRTRPVKELKGFELVALKPGEAREISFVITPSLLAFYTAENQWTAEEGEFQVFVGGSSSTTLEAGFTYKK